MFSKIYDEAQAGNGGLVDLAHRIVDEEARNEHGKRENPHIVVVILVKAAQALGVDHQHIHLLTRLREAGDRCAPDMDTFRARMDRGSDAEPALTVQ